MRANVEHHLVHCYPSTPLFQHPSKRLFTRLRWQALRVSLFVVWSLLVSSCRGDDAEEVTGATSAFNGYDHLTGAKPICWQGMTAINNTDNSNPSNIMNPFDVTTNGNNIDYITPLLMPSCPMGTQITARLSKQERKLDALPDGTWMGITNAIYEFDVQGSIDLSHWNASNSSQWNANLQIGISMVLCSVETIRFCTPFLHYETEQLAGTVGTVHGTSHVDTIVNQISMIGSNFSTTVSLKVDEPGAFSVVVGAFFIYATDDPTSHGSRLVLHPAQLSNVASDYPVIAFWDVKVSRPARLAAYILVACSASIILFLLLSVMRHRKSRVLKLTQRNLLVAMLATALIATVFAMTFEPRNSLYCNLQGPLVILPLHVLFSILLGRLWRIQAILSPMLLITLEREKTWSDRFVEWLRLATELPQQSKTSPDSGHRGSFKSIFYSIGSSLQGVWKLTSNIRQPRPTPTARAIHFKICERQVARVVVIFCIPQVVVQVLYLILAKQRLVNGVCPSSFLASSANGFGGVLLLLLVLLLLALARSSKDLPTLFNENEALWDVALVSLVLLGVGFVVTIITRSPTTKPDIRYIVSTLTVVAITTNASLKLVVPKLRKIWMKEIVVVTKLISDHNRMERSPLPGFFGETTLREVEDSQRQQGGSTFTSSNPPSLHENGNVNVAAHDGPESSKGHESDDSSVVFVHHEETEQGLAPTVQSEAEESGAQPNWSLDSLQSIPAFDAGSERVQNDRTVESLPQNISYGLPTRSNLLESFSSIPENASVPMALIDRFPSSVGSIPTSEASPSHHEMSRTNFSRGTHASIVKNRSRWSFRHLGHLSQDSNNSPTSDAMSHNGNHANPLRPNNKGGQLLDIGYNPRRRKRSIRIVAGNAEEPAPRRLLLRMIHVHHKLGLVNRSILLGNQVSREDWELLRDEVVALGRVFEHEVRFEWESPVEGLDEPALLAAKSAPVRRGSYSKQRKVVQPSSLSRLTGDGDNADSFSTSAAPAPGASDPSLKAGGRVITGMLHHIPRPRAGKSSLARASTDPFANENRVKTTSLERSVSGGGVGAVSTSASLGASGPGHLAPSSRERFTGGGKRISGLWHHVPRPRSRDGTTTRATTVPGPLKADAASSQSASHLVVLDDDSESKNEEEVGEDDWSLEAPSSTLPSRTRELLRPGRPVRRSRFRSNGLSSSLQTIHSVSDSVTSGHDSGLITSAHDSGLISSGVFVSFDNNLEPNSPVSVSEPDAMTDLTAPLPQPGPPTAQVSSLCHGTDRDESDGNGDQI